MDPLVFEKGNYRAQLTRAQKDIRAAQHLRYRAFFDSDGSGRDDDDFDKNCAHVLIEDRRSGALAGCYRLMALENGREISHSYSAQFYDLSALEAYPGKMIEMGRFCTVPGLRDPEILRVAWAMMTRIVDNEGFEMMFGCSSFSGVDRNAYNAAFALLKQRYQAPENWRPRVRAPEVVHFGLDRPVQSAKRQAMRDVPSLLRTYLIMGGWVSDHAVIDRDLNTMHVFTGLEVAKVPEGRARVLRDLAG